MFEKSFEPGLQISGSQGESDTNCGPVCARLHVHAPLQIADTFAHSGHSDACVLNLNSASLVYVHTCAIVVWISKKTDSSSCERPIFAVLLPEWR